MLKPVFKRIISSKNHQSCNFRTDRELRRSDYDYNTIAAHLSGLAVDGLSNIREMADQKSNDNQQRNS